MYNICIVMNTYDSTYTHKYQSFFLSILQLHILFMSFCYLLSFFKIGFFLLHQLVKPGCCRPTGAPFNKWGIEENRCPFVMRSEQVPFLRNLWVLGSRLPWPQKKFMLPWCFILMWSHETLLSSKVESKWAWDGGGRMTTTGPCGKWDTFFP